jgi:hypothetical protein
MVTLLGWLGAMLALAAYAQTRAARFRQIALLSSVALLTFNVLLGIWSNVVLESALGIVNVGRLVQLRVPTVVLEPVSPPATVTPAGHNRRTPLPARAAHTPASVCPP